MASPETAKIPRPKGHVAYLVVRAGGKWRDVFRLIPGQVTTIGRAPTNRIVVADEACSRNHCEVSLSDGQWVLRDLGSRNGSMVDGAEVEGDWALDEGQVVRIGSTMLGFTYDLTHSLPDVDDFQAPPDDIDTAFDLVCGEPDEEPVEPAIVHRQRETRFDRAQDESKDDSSRELARLYKLGLEMGGAGDVESLADVVLEGLFQATCGDIGAILLLPEDASGPPQPEDLSVVAYRAPSELPYQKVSDHLTNVVLDMREAVLARDVADDSHLAARDSLGDIHAKSVICTPIRTAQRVLGVLHLYSTNPDNPLDPNDLEFTLAVADQLAVALTNMQLKASLEDGLAKATNENIELREQLEIDSKLVGKSPVIEELRQNMTRIAPTDATVLIRGESGVGKELVARAIHFGSQRANGPCVCMNCAALTESLLESELFGHEKGAFTGATQRKIGKFEQAHRGSLFLDEVGEMSLAIQAKFLRVLEGHPFERVGGGDPVQVDVRVIAATNRDLEQAVRDGAFRQDLYFRLHVVELEVPPLRERDEDVALLARYFLQRFARKTGRPVRDFTPDALDVLRDYEWPGNVRELRNAVERSVILCRGEQVGAGDLQLSSLESREPGPSSSGPRYRELSLQELEQEHILATLERTGWNKSQAAQILGIERSTLDRKLKRYRVSRPKA